MRRALKHAATVGLSLGVCVGTLVFSVACVVAGVTPARAGAEARGALEHTPEPASAPRATATSASALPRFALFGWVSPPDSFSTPARYAELAATGFNLTVLAWDDSGTATQNLRRLDLARPFGLGCLLVDNDLDSVFIDRPASLLLADTIVARYRDDPAFLGYYLGDEPPATAFPRLGEWFYILGQRDTEHPSWNSLGPRGAFASSAAFEAYVQDYVAFTHPAVLCNNQYDFTIFGDSRFLTENISVLGRTARANAIPFWGVVQLVEHFIFRHVTEGMLRWQVAQWLAWGASGIGYFTYWTPAPNAEYQWQPAMIEWGTGNRTAYYTMVTALNARLAPIGNTLAGCTWRATMHAGSVPPGGVAFTPDSVLLGVSGRATLGVFSDSTGASLLFVANADSAAERTVTLTLAAGWRAARLRDDGGAWDWVTIGANGALPLALAAGDFALLRIASSAPAVSAEPPGPAALGLRVSPNPAGGPVRFARAATARAACLDVLDLAGRVVWSRDFAAGEREVTWAGPRDGAARTAAGVYFARLRDDRGAVVRRVAWLGSR